MIHTQLPITFAVCWGEGNPNDLSERTRILVLGQIG